MYNFPWVIFLFSLLVWISLIVYLYLLKKHKYNIRKIMIIGDNQKLEFLTKEYKIVESFLDFPDLIISFSDNIFFVESLVSLNIPIVSFGNFNIKEKFEIVKIAKYYHATIIIDVNFENIREDIQNIRKGHIIKIYQ